MGVRATEGHRAASEAAGVADARGIGDGSPPVQVHRGGCHTAQGVRVKEITADQARRALYEHVEAFSVCNPDTALRVIPEQTSGRTAPRAVH